MTNPFTPPNDRIAGFCQAVLTKSRVTTLTGGSASPSDATVLKGVQAIGVSRSLDHTSYADVGRMQQKYGRYGKTTYEITISRVLSKGEDFFYNTSGLSAYADSHILSTNTANTIGFTGINDRLKNYDIVLIYGSDDVGYIGEPTSTSLMSKTYRCCILTAISYTIPIQGPITEDLTFTTHAYTQDDITTTGGFSNLNFEHTGEETLQRKDILTNSCVFPFEVQKAFDLSTNLDSIPILGLQQIEISTEINYRDLEDIGKWGGSVSDRAEMNKYKQIELPVGVSCTFSGVVRAQYFVDAAQDHEVTDTYHTAGTYGSETKNVNLEQYQSDRSITIVAQGDGSNLFQWNLGQKNYISSFEITGGDADGGGNVEASMSFQNDHSEIFLLKDTTVRSFTSSTTI